MTVFSLLSLPCTPPGFPKFLRAAPNARQCLGVKGVAGSMENPAQRVLRGFARPAGDGREGKNPVLCSFSPRGGPGGWGLGGGVMGVGMPSTLVGIGVESMGPIRYAKAFGLHILPRFSGSLVKEFSYETQTQARLRPQSVSRQSRRRQNHFKIPEGSNRLFSRRGGGCCFLHSARQDQNHRRFRARQRSSRCDPWNWRFLRRGVLDRAATAHCYGGGNDGVRDRAAGESRHHSRTP